MDQFDDDPRDADRAPPPPADRGGDEPPPDDAGRGDEPPGEGGPDKGPEGLSHPAAWHDYMKCHAHHQKYSLGDGGAAAPAMPGATNGALPRPKPRHDEEPGRMARKVTQPAPARKSPEQVEMEHLKSLIYSMGRKVDSIASERDDYATKARRAEVKDLLRKEFAGKVCDLEREVDYYLREPEDGRDDYLAYRKVNMLPDPGADRREPDIRGGRPTTSRATGDDGTERVAVRGGSEGGPGAGGDEFGEEELRRFQRHLAEHPGDEAGAWKYAREQSNGQARRR